MLRILAASFLAVAIAGGASAASSTVPFIAPGSPPSYVPEGSTWVPRRDDLGGENTPQSVGTLCKPNVGTPMAAPSQLDAAVSPTTGVIVSSEGYLVFDRSDPAGCASQSFSAWDTLFSYSNAHTFSEPRVVYDTYVHKFVIAVFLTDTTTSHVYVYLATGNSDGTGWSGGFANVTGMSATFLDLSLGYDKDKWLVGFDYPITEPLEGVAVTIDKSTGQAVYSTIHLPSHPIAPIVLDNSTTDYFLAVDTTDKNNIWRIAAVFGPPSSSLTTTAISVPAFDLPPTVTQSNGATLAADDGHFHAPTIQIGNSLWNVHTIGVDGNARVRMYKLDTTATSPVTTFTPMINGDEDIFAPSLATASDAAGSTAFLTATYNNANMAGSPLYALAFSGPNDSTAGWTYDVVASDSNFTTDGSQWATHSATTMNPGDATGWGFNQLASGSAATDWSLVGAEITSPGAPFAAPIASAATGVGHDAFTANWSTTNPAATGYELDVATDAAFTSFVPGYQAKNVGNVTSIGVTDLPQDSTYYYRVRAVGATLSGNSNVIDVSTTAIGPLELMALSLLAIGGLGFRPRKA